MKYISLIQVVLCALFLSACATVAKGPSYLESKARKALPDRATVYVLREYAEPTAWGANIQIDGKPVADLNQGGFTWIYIKPGKTEIKAVWSGMSSQKDSFISIDTEAGKTYYVELTGVSQLTGVTLTMMYFKVGSGLSEVKPEAAVKKLETCCKFQKPGSDIL
jgi:hypothetical protein